MSTAGQRWRAVVTAGRTSLWPVPVASVVLALVAGVLLPRLDRAVDDALPAGVSDLLFSGGPGAARTVLDAISSSLITVTSLTFSLTVVTLQLASSQFSPRLLRTFTRDRFVHATLGVFLATFTYALTVERTVRSADEEGSAFVPQLSVTLGFVMAIASVITLVLFLAHLAGQIRVETMLDTVHRDAGATARAVLGDPVPRGEVPDALTGDPAVELHPPASAVPLLAGRSGFLVRVDEDQLLAAVVRAGALAVVEPLPGSPVVAGTPVGWVWPAGTSALDDEALEDLLEALGRAVVIGAERTEAQDVAFGVRQLTDVAVKALSPGINDPTTAVHALGHSASLLCELADLPLGPRGLREDGEPPGPWRVVVARPALADLLDLAVSQPRRYGSADPAVMAAVGALLRALAWRAAPADRGVVEAQRLRWRATVDAGDHDATEVEALGALDAQVRHALAGVWRPSATERRLALDERAQG